MRTRPVARASGIVSCMRFRQRTKVDFPQPDGPITAVAWLAATVMLMSCRAWVLPNQAFSLSTWMPTPIISVRSLKHTSTGHKTHRADRGDNEHNQDQRSRPGQAVPFVEGRNGVSEDLQGQRSCGLVHFPIPVLIAEGGKKQGSGFSGDASEGQHYPGNHARGGGAKRDRESCAPP